MLFICTKCGKKYLRKYWINKHIENKCQNAEIREYNLDNEISEIDFLKCEISMLKRQLNELKNQKVNIQTHDIAIERVKNTCIKYVDERAKEMQKCFYEFEERIASGNFKLTPVPKEEIHHIYNYNTGEVINE